MAQKSDLEHWVLNALRDLGGEAPLVRVAEHIWSNHESELKQSGDLLYTWQYDMRWAAQRLKDRGILIKNPRSWALK
jgi:hypothetical protein